MKKLMTICFGVLFVLLLGEVVSPNTAEAQLFCRARRCCAPVVQCCPTPVCCPTTTCCQPRRLFGNRCCNPCNTCATPCATPVMDCGCGTVGGCGMVDGCGSVGGCGMVDGCGSAGGCGGGMIMPGTPVMDGTIIESPASDVPAVAPEASEDSVPAAPAEGSEA